LKIGVDGDRDAVAGPLDVHLVGKNKGRLAVADYDEFDVVIFRASSSCTGFDACREQGTRCTWPETLASVTQLICSGAGFAAQDASSSETHRTIPG
jgi:hypothetical protein